jgi:hypothetical protein
MKKEADPNTAAQHQVPHWRGDIDQLPKQSPLFQGYDVLDAGTGAADP